jgi:Xylose isomerase-like TIM barrel
MDRREFLTATVSFSVTGLMTSSHLMNQSGEASGFNPEKQIQYSVSYDDCIQSVQPILSESPIQKPFSNMAIEDYGFCSRSESSRRDVSQFLINHQCQMGLFAGSVNYGRPVFSSGRRQDREIVFQQLHRAVKLTKQVKGKWCSVIPGKSLFGVSWKRQSQNGVELLKSLSEYAEKENLVLLLEPVNYLDKRSEMLIPDIQQAYEICERVNNPSCKMLYDFRLQRILGRNIFNDISQYGHRIGYYQLENRNPFSGELQDNFNSHAVLEKILTSNLAESVVVGNYSNLV